MKDILRRLVSGETLGMEDTKDIMLRIVSGEYVPEQVSGILSVIQSRGVSVDEILGFRSGLLETGRHIDLSEFDAVDIVGTGGDCKNTFNISTCSCFVVAGAGYKVAKHGNYASTSVSGASNVLEAHGVKFTNDADKLKKSIEKSGVAYMHAPLFATGMKNVAPIRKAIGVPTVFNLLGPLINPSTPKFQCLGTANFEQMRLYTHVNERLGVKYVIVSSTDGYDEISLTSSYKVSSVGMQNIYAAESFGLSKVRPESIYGGETIEQASHIFDSVLDGTSSKECRDVVLINAAVAISVVSGIIDINECLDKARQSVESGKALECFKKFVECNQ